SERSVPRSSAFRRSGRSSRSTSTPLEVRSRCNPCIGGVLYDCPPMRRTIVLLGTIITTLAVTASAAMAAAPTLDGGQGTLGENNDLQVTLFGFAVLVGLTAFITVMSLLQWRLDKRKYARQAAEKARAA